LLERAVTVLHHLLLAHRSPEPVGAEVVETQMEQHRLEALAVVALVIASILAVRKVLLELQTQDQVVVETLIAHLRLVATAAPVWSSSKCQIPSLQPSQVV
jgi:hypothetical protein